MGWAVVFVGGTGCFLLCVLMFCALFRLCVFLVLSFCSLFDVVFAVLFCFVLMLLVSEALCLVWLNVVFCFRFAR